MISPDLFCEQLEANGIDTFFGVPDSLLKNLCAYIDHHYAANQHIISANEGNAIALGLGYHLASGKSAMVYLQNSGLGNTINPLVSLADPEVYSVPMLLVIGWRGEPGIKDEPQHIKQGAITRSQLDVLGIPHMVLDASSDLEPVNDLCHQMLREQRPVALLIRQDTFASHSPQSKHLVKDATLGRWTREAVLDVLTDILPAQDLVVSTTGKTSRELFELRKRKGQANTDFLTVGGMGHTSSIAMGIALGAPHRRVVAIDGDGSFLMHMGASAIIGCHKVTNLIHVVLNNECHESVGGQPTVAGKIDLRSIVEGCQYKTYSCVSSKEELLAQWTKISKDERSGPHFMEVKIAPGSRTDLGRPDNTPKENKTIFMSER